jgi:multiple sugar transport system substrate-binding protein/raffinose/stachyose/melibiose transport system substrate-binding protein
MKGLRIAVVALLLLALAAAAFAQDLILMHDKGGNPNYQPFYEAMGKEAKAKIGVGFTPTPYPTTDVFISAVRAALPTRQAPDLFTWWSTYRMKDLIDQGLVAETTELWDKHKAEYPQGLRDAFTFDGKVYGFAYVVEYWGVWYNTEVFAKFKLSPPKTWAEFLKVCATLKAGGVTPMLMTVQQRWPTFILFEEFIARQNPSLYVDLCEGRAKYTDLQVKMAFKVWADLIAKGYFSDPSVDMFSEAPQLFNQGKIAMIPCGSWYMTVLTSNGVPESKIDIFVMPSHNRSAGKVAILEATPILISKNAPNLDAAKKVVDYWMGPEGNAFYAKLVGQYPANAKADTSYLAKARVNFRKTLVGENYRILNRFWEATPTPICEQAVDKFAEFILNPDSVDRVLSDLDKIADEYWAKNK